MCSGWFALSVMERSQFRVCPSVTDVTLSSQACCLLFLEAAPPEHDCIHEGARWPAAVMPITFLTSVHLCKSLFLTLFYKQAHRSYMHFPPLPRPYTASPCTFFYCNLSFSSPEPPDSTTKSRYLHSFHVTHPGHSYLSPDHLRWSCSCSVTWKHLLTY